ncbi:MAG: thioesterase family protein [Caulobacteraceae bacterium]|nr:thioesterase family protein [Caulobacteraceae bacterium]
MRHAYFRREGRLYHPDRTARGPWNPDQQSGLAVQGVLVHAIETTPSAAPMRIARLTVDFLGAVLMRPTEARVRILRDGEGLQTVEASLWVEGEMAATATGLRVSRGEDPPASSPPLSYPDPEAAPRVPVTKYFDAGHPLETRVIRKAGAEGGPGVFWSRFNSVFLEGEPNSPVTRACMAADIASAPAAPPALKGWRNPNADLSLYLAREPRGDWLLCAAHTDVAAEGFAVLRSTLADADGVFGYGRQTLMLSPARPPA